MKVLKQNVYSVPILNIKNRLHINNSKIEMEKVKCKDIYWHLINIVNHTPKAILAWENVYTSLKNKEDKLRDHLVIQCIYGNINATHVV